MNPTRLDISRWAWCSYIFRLARAAVGFRSTSAQELRRAIHQNFERIVLVRIMDASNSMVVMIPSGKFRALLTPFHGTEIDPASHAATGFYFAAR